MEESDISEQDQVESQVESQAESQVESQAESQVGPEPKKHTCKCKGSCKNCVCVKNGEICGKDCKYVINFRCKLILITFADAPQNVTTTGRRTYLLKDGLFYQRMMGNMNQKTAHSNTMLGIRIFLLMQHQPVISLSYYCQKS